MGHLGALALEAFLNRAGQSLQDGVRVEPVSIFQLHRAIQPAEQRFAFRIKLVVHVHRCARGLLSGGKAMEPRVQSRPFTRRRLKNLRLRKFVGQLAAQSLPPRCIEQIAFVDDDEVGLLELLAVNVENLLGELAAALQPEHAQRANRVRQHTEWCDGKVAAVNQSQRIRDRRDEVSATADRLGNEHVRPRRRCQFVRRVHEGVEPATKTTARNFFGRESPRTQHRRVDQLASLVVGNEPDAQALAGQMLRQPRHRRRFARAKKAADHDVTGFVGGPWSVVRGFRTWQLTTDN